MTHHLPQLIMPGLFVLLSASGCSGASRVSACDVARADAEQAVRALSANYSRVRDVETEVNEFAEDVWFFSTLTPVPTVGKAARRATIEKRRAPVPGENTRRETSGVIVSECGDLAVEHGRYVTSWTGPAGTDSAGGFYLMAYRKENNEWKIAAASVHRRP